jgi:hypothetical protein
LRAAHTAIHAITHHSASIQSLCGWDRRPFAHDWDKVLISAASTAAAAAVSLLVLMHGLPLRLMASGALTVGSPHSSGPLT